jgi:hypothetical protein
MTRKSAIQIVTTTILNFSGRFLVATLFKKINSALFLKLSKTCFIALNMYLAKNYPVSVASFYIKHKTKTNGIENETAAIKRSTVRGCW